MEGRGGEREGEGRTARLPACLAEGDVFVVAQNEEKAAGQPLPTGSITSRSPTPRGASGRRGRQCALPKQKGTRPPLLNARPYPQPSRQAAWCFRSTVQATLVAQRSKVQGAVLPEDRHPLPAVRRGVMREEKGVRRPRPNARPQPATFTASRLML